MNKSLTHVMNISYPISKESNQVEFIPVSRSLLWVDTLVDGVVKNEAVSAAKLYRVHPKLAVDVLPDKSKGEGFVLKVQLLKLTLPA